MDGAAAGNDELATAHSPADYLRLARGSGVTEPIQLALVEKDYSFVNEALAANPATTTTVLLMILRNPFVSDYSWNHTLELIARHSSATHDVLLSVRDRVLDAFRSGERPYAAGRALAERTEIAVPEVMALLQVPGGSSRFRRMVEEAIATRGQQ